MGVVISVLLAVIIGILIYFAIKIKPITEEVICLRKALEKIQKNPRGDAVDRMTVTEATKNYYRIMHEITKITGIFAKQTAVEVSKIFAKK